MRGSVLTLSSFGSLTLWCNSAAKENRKGKRNTSLIRQTSPR